MYPATHQDGRGSCCVCAHVCVFVILCPPSSLYLPPLPAQTSAPPGCQESKRSVFRVLDRVSAIDARAVEGLRPERLHGRVEFVHVTFRSGTVAPAGPLL
jgi:hypothetical protein